MTDCPHRYAFSSQTDMADVDAALLLALWGVESLHGEPHAHLETRYLLDEVNRLCIVEAKNSVGRDFSRLFQGYLSRELGEDAFTVSRVDVNSPRSSSSN